MAAFIRSRSSRSAGFSLLEVMLTVAILPIVLGAAYQVFITLSGNYSTIGAQSEATSEAQRALDVLVREIRQAQETSIGAGAFPVAQERLAVFYADIDRDGIPERIKYEVDGSDLYRSQDEARSAVAPYDYPDDGESGDTPALRVVNLTTSSDVVFTYYLNGAPDVPVGEPTEEQRPKISSVGVHLSAARPAQGGIVQVNFSTRVKVRALFNDL